MAPVLAAPAPVRILRRVLAIIAFLLVLAPGFDVPRKVSRDVWRTGAIGLRPISAPRKRPVQRERGIDVRVVYAGLHLAPPEIGLAAKDLGLRAMRIRQVVDLQAEAHLLDPRMALEELEEPGHEVVGASLGRDDVGIGVREVVAAKLAIELGLPECEI